MKTVRANLSIRVKGKLYVPIESQRFWGCRPHNCRWQVGRRCLRECKDHKVARDLPLLLWWVGRTDVRVAETLEPMLVGDDVFETDRGWLLQEVDMVNRRLRINLSTVLA